MIEGLDVRDPAIRMLDQSRIGRDPDRRTRKRCMDGPPVTALLIQNTNPVSVAPEQEQVKRGFARDDLFVCVHEQFMTETARMADIVLPATMFMEHDDVYQAGGHQYIMLGPKLIDPPGECRCNHDVICGTGASASAPSIPGFDMTPRELIDWTLQNSGWGTLGGARMRALDRLPAAISTRAHYLDGLRLAATASSASSRTGRRCRSAAHGTCGPVADMPALAGSLERRSRRRRRASVSAGDIAGAQFPQLDLQRDADVAAREKRRPR